MEKMCSSYVHISHLIWDLKNSERKERISMQRNQWRTDEESKEVVSLAGNNLSGLRNGLNGAVSANSIGGSAMEKNSVEARKGIFSTAGAPSRSAAASCIWDLHFSLSKYSSNSI